MIHANSSRSIAVAGPSDRGNILRSFGRQLRQMDADREAVTHYLGEESMNPVDDNHAWGLVIEELNWLENFWKTNARELPPLLFHRAIERFSIVESAMWAVLNDDAPFVLLENSIEEFHDSVLLSARKAWEKKVVS